MIRGMSYKNGIFFINQKGMAHATLTNGKVVTCFQPISPQAFLFLFQRLMVSFPAYLLILVLILSIFILRPNIIFAHSMFNALPEVPLYSMVLLLFAYHLIFPKQLKKYHGAEHKVFSYKGRKHLSRIKQIAAANIVNRNCSTNAVVLFFIFFLISFPLLGGWLSILIGWFAMLIIPRFWKWGDTHIFFPLSAFLQKKITTAEPEQEHLRVAILSYMSLIAQRALDEEEVWTAYEKELEMIRKQEEKRRMQLELERITRLIVEQEREQMKLEKIRDDIVLNGLSLRSAMPLLDKPQKERITQ